MIDRPTKERPDTVRLRYELDAPPSKVWRAIRTPELRDAWLPAGDLADPEPVSETVGQEVQLSHAGKHAALSGKCRHVRNRTEPKVAGPFCGSSMN